jgi:hypothetical protein
LDWLSLNPKSKIPNRKSKDLLSYNFGDGGEVAWRDALSAIVVAHLRFAAALGL